MRRKFISMLLVSLVISAARSGSAQTSALRVSAAGVATVESGTLIVAAPLTNLADRALSRIVIDRVRFATAVLRTKLPITIEAIRGNASAILQVEFDGRSLVPDKPYQLVIAGTYRDATGVSGPFTTSTVVFVPPSSPGSRDTRRTQVPAHKVEGGHFPPQKPRMDRDVNGAAPPVPTTPPKGGARTPTPTAVRPAPIGDPPGVMFNANRSVGGSFSNVAEPSGASGGGVIFVSANWGVAYSTDGGTTFTQLNPTTIFPADSVGFCCDQVIQYAAKIDRFIWLLQGTGYRLAVASPADIRNSGGTAWTYWNLTPGLFGKCTGPDYPDLAVGDGSLYISWDAMGGSCTSGFQVVRASLAGLQAAGTITLDYTDPANAPGSKIWGEHLTQNTGDEIFWAGHNGNSTLTVYSLKENSNTYFWRDVNISSWANNAPTSTTPDGVDWLAKNFNGPGGNSFPRNGIIGAARSGRLIWFGWTAGTNSSYRQAHVEIVTLDRGNNFSRTQQVQVWNNSYAFAYPAFSSNGCTGELGMSFEYGGNGNWENHVVGFWGDFIAYITTNSNIGDNRFGDYVTIRRAPVTSNDPGNLFTAFGFGRNKAVPPQTQNTSDVHYVLFGRPKC
jgi:hypothetical protein